MEAASTSETSVGNYFARQYIPEDNSEQYTRWWLKFKESHFIAMNKYFVPYHIL
jgi:hypothetical protein